MARKEFVAAQRCLAGCPFVRQDEQAAEATGRLLEALDAGDAVVGRAHDPLPRLGHALDQFVARGFDWSSTPQHGAEVVQLVRCRALAC